MSLDVAFTNKSFGRPQCIPPILGPVGHFSGFHDLYFHC